MYTHSKDKYLNSDNNDDSPLLLQIANCCEMAKSKGKSS